MPLRKQFVLINSDDRTATSNSTTDFNVVLREPINNVVKTDLVAVSMDYNMANVTAPNNTFQIKTSVELSPAVEAQDAYTEEIPAVPAVILTHDAIPAVTHNEVTAAAGWYFRAVDTTEYILLTDYSRTEPVGYFGPRTGEDPGSYWNRAEEYIVVVDEEEIPAYDEIITPEIPAQTINHPAVPAVPAIYGEATADYTIDEDQYTPAELRAMLEEVFGGQNGYFDVFLVNRNLRIEYWFAAETTVAQERVFKFVCNNSTLRTVLGMTSSTLTGTYLSTIGDFGGSRINFPRAVRLPSTSPFIMIQSAELGIKTKTSNGLGFWRALINDPSTDTLQIANNRTDEYLDEPKRLQDIDIRLGFPNGAKVDNRGAAFSILIEVVTDEEIKRNTE
jgi:hypothetical protein